MSYTKPRLNGLVPPINGKSSFKEKYSELTTTLFPTPLTQDPLPDDWLDYEEHEWGWGELTLPELRPACSNKAVKGKTPGPDGVTQLVISRAFEYIPYTFLSVFSRLINEGYYPKV